MKSSTVLSALTARLREQARRFNPDIEAAPVAILWTDERREWEALLPALKEALPELHSLGAYSPEQRSGPGVWLRMVADGCAGARSGQTPILYLPGVGNSQLRTDLRGLKEDPQLAPLAELQYRGGFWRQENGKDWTFRAFLESRRGGLGLKVSGSKETQQALKAAGTRLLQQNLAALEGQTIDERYLDDLINPAPDHSVLAWLTRPQAVQEEKGAHWESFVATACSRYGVDLGKGPLVVAQQILASQPGDAAFGLWERYAAHWQSYPELYESFRPIAPTDLFQGPDRYPRENEREETELAEALLAAAQREPTAAAEAIQALEARHAPRRGTLWARQGHAPLATALGHLAAIAEACGSALCGGTPAEAGRWYAQEGWRIDAAARAAMTTAQRADREAPVYAVLQALYRRWLVKQAEGFQALVQQGGYPHWQLPDVTDGTVVLFVDGLRMDLARELEERLQATERGLAVSIEPGFTSIPSVTSSGKVWVSPAGRLAQGGTGTDFEPRLPKGAYTADKLRKTLEAEGFVIVDAENPSVATGKGWAEFAGDIDSDGHNKGLRLARALDGHLDDLVRTIHRLLTAGWRAVWVVTDHGWLLLPGGLPKAELSSRLTETKWGRCAVLKSAVAELDGLALPWSFDPAVQITLAPGISAFVNGREYDHGGLSLQESVVPWLRVARQGPVLGQPQIRSVSWNSRKTICSVVASDAAGLGVSIERLGSAVGESGTISDGGQGRVIFEEVDDLLGEQITVVLRREDVKVAEEQANFGEAWHGA